jgi:competence protein ComEC
VRIREPLLLPALFAGIGIAFGFLSAPGSTSLLLAFALLAGLAALAFAVPSPRAGRVALYSALFAGGALLPTLRPSPIAPHLSVPDNTPAILQGCVVDPALIATDREKFVLELAPGARAQVSLYSHDENFPALPYGALIEFTGKVRTTHNYRNPGSFDAVHYLARQRIYWNVSADSAAIRILPGQCGNAIGRFIYSVRTTALDRLDHLYEKDTYTDGMMQGLLIGATAKLERAWTEDYRSTGTFHALVISGGHVAVLAGVLLFTLRLFGVPQSFALFATILMAWLYAGVAGWQAPVLRSAAGMTLFAIGGAFYRRPRILNMLAAVALAFIVFDPEQVFDASFQLSFGAVALIGAFVIPALDKTSAPLTAGFRQLDDSRSDIRLSPRTAQFRVELRLLIQTLEMLHIPRTLASFLVTGPARLAIFLWDMVVASFFIQLGLTLPMVFYFHRLNLSGLSANALVVPILSAVVPLGFLAILTNSHPLAQVCATLLSLSKWAVGIHARWEPDWRIPGPPFWLAAAFGVALIWAAWRNLKAPWNVAAWISVAAALAAIGIHPFPPQTEPRRLELAAIDVGQGDSLLIAFPDGKLMLIDAGGIPAFGRARKPNIDIGEDVVSPYLWSRSIKHLDIVAMTHAHDDHMGGMPAVLRNFHPRELWTGATQESREWVGVRSAAAQLNIPVRHLERCSPFSFGGANIQVLAPAPDYQPESTPKNDDSLVMRISYGETAFLLTGDMEKRIEEDLYFSGLLRHADVLKVGHHGSRTSTTPDLLDAVHPAFGIISDGFDNNYGHPHPLTLAALAERHVSILRTDQHGLIDVTSDGRRIRIN